MSLGDLQQMTMLAVARLGDDAFGAAIQDELETVAGRTVTVPTVYVTLVRLEEQGLVASRRLEPEPERGGRGKRVFRLTAEGRTALAAARDAMASLWDGVVDA